MKTVVIVPMKDAAASKTRLAGAMSAPDRERMSLGLFQRSQDFFAAQFPEFERLVVTSSSSIAALAECSGARVLLEHAPPAGLNSAVRTSFDWARSAGFERLLIVPADIAVWLRSEVEELLEEGARYPVVIASSYDGGTNGLLIDLVRTDRFHFRYGPDSARRHFDSATALSLGVTMRNLPFLSRDIDTMDDCLLLSEKLAKLAYVG